MTTKLTGAHSIKVGSYIIADGVACRVSNMSVSRPGKHGHAKFRFEAVGLFDGKKREMVVPGSDNVEVPIVDKRSAQVLSISENHATVMDSESFETFELDIPSELEGQVSEGTNVLYWEVLGERVMKQVKSE